MCGASSPEPLSVVIIDDDRVHLSLIERAVKAACRQDGLAVECCLFEDPNAAFVGLPERGPVVVLIDYQLSGTTGLEWLSDFVRINAGPTIVVTSSGDEGVAAEAFRRGAADYLVKTEIISRPDLLARAIRESLRRHQVFVANRELSRSLKTANRELEKKNIRLGELTATAHRYVEDVAHEFRTPLTVIREFASIMSDGIGGGVTGQQSGYLQHIINASRDLAGLVDDFLDNGKLRAGTLRVDRAAHRPSDLIAEAWAAIECRAAQRKARVVRDIPADLPDVFVDADKFTRSLLNLVTNAIKFTEVGGEVRVSASLEPDGSVRVSVSDSGPGIPPEGVEELFGRFRQGLVPAPTDAKGFGLGLGIVKDLVGINLGQVSVSSELGRGSTFSFTSPTDDPACIVRCLLDRVAERDPSPTVSCLKISASNASPSELAATVSSICKATDVIRAHPERSSLIAIGETIDPDAWRARVLANVSRRPESERHSGVPEIELIGQWSLIDAQQALTSILLEHEVQERSVA